MFEKNSISALCDDGKRCGAMKSAKKLLSLLLTIVLVLGLLPTAALAENTTSNTFATNCSWELTQCGERVARLTIRAAGADAAFNGEQLTALMTTLYEKNWPDGFYPQILTEFVIEGSITATGSLDNSFAGEDSNLYLNLVYGDIAGRDTTGVTYDAWWFDDDTSRALDNLRTVVLGAKTVGVRPDIPETDLWRNADTGTDYTSAELNALEDPSGTYRRMYSFGNNCL